MPTFNYRTWTKKKGWEKGEFRAKDMNDACNRLLKRIGGSGEVQVWPKSKEESNGKGSNGQG
jgi:hypothetical protein